MENNWNILSIIMWVSAFLLILALWIGGMLLWHIRKTAKTNKMNSRLGVSDQHSDTRRIWLWRDGEQASTVVPGEPPRPTLVQRLNRLRESAGLAMSLRNIVLILSLASFMTFMILYAMSGIILLGALGVAAVIIGYWMYLQRRMAQIESLFETQFVDGLELAARSLRAGHPLVASFRVIADEVPAPVGPIFSYICHQQTMGVSFEESLRGVAENSTSADLKLFATSVSIQLRSGGSLADMMERLASVIRDRMRLNRRVRVLTAQTQFSKRLLLAMPILLFVVLDIMNPKYMELMYTTAAGKMLLVLAGGLMLLGAWIMNRLAVVRY